MPQSKNTMKKNMQHLNLMEHTEVFLNQYGYPESSQTEDEPTWMYWSIAAFILITFSILLYGLLHYLEML